MNHIEKSIEVDVPVRTAYNQWTQFEEFPQFMEGIESVEQIDDKRLHWKASIAGKVKEWDAEIFEQVPDQIIAWRSMSGALNTGRVAFTPIDANRTLVMLRINYDPEGALENIGNALGIVERRVENDLKKFKTFIEARGRETGAWRGEILGKKVRCTPTGRTSEAMNSSVAEQEAREPRSKKEYNA